MKCAKIFEADESTQICLLCSRLSTCDMGLDFDSVVECCDYVQAQPAQAGEVER